MYLVRILGSHSCLCHWDFLNVIYTKNKIFQSLNALLFNTPLILNMQSTDFLIIEGQT